VDYLNVIVTHPFLMLWAGQLLHMLKEVKEVENQVPGVTIRLYVKRHKYGVIFSVIAGLVVYAILYQMGELSPLSAFMAGYMSESVINAAATRVTRKVSGDEFGMHMGTPDGMSGFEEGRPYDYYDWYKSEGVARKVGHSASPAGSESQSSLLEGQDRRREGPDGRDHRGAGERRNSECLESGGPSSPSISPDGEDSPSARKDRGGNQ